MTKHQDNYNTYFKIVEGLLYAPKVNNMAKNSTAQSGAIGKRVTKSGYAINASPVPPWTTFLISTPSSLALKKIKLELTLTTAHTLKRIIFLCGSLQTLINSLILTRNPRIENMANPANTDVKQFPKHTIKVSLVLKNNLSCVWMFRNKGMIIILIQ